MPIHHSPFSNSWIIFFVTPAGADVYSTGCQPGDDMVFVTFVVLGLRRSYLKEVCQLTPRLARVVIFQLHQHFDKPLWPLAPTLWYARHQKGLRHLRIFGGLNINHIITCDYSLT